MTWKSPCGSQVLSWDLWHQGEQSYLSSDAAPHLQLYLVKQVQNEVANSDDIKLSEVIKVLCGVAESLQSTKWLDKEMAGKWIGQMDVE